MPTHRTSNRRTILKSVGGAVGTGALGALAGCAGGGDGDGERPDGGDGDGGGAAETDTPPSTTQTTSQDAVKVGGLVPVSGPYTPLGQSLQQGIEAKVAHINQQGGINGRDVEAVFEDTQGDPQAGQQAARRLVDSENVDALVGPISSAVAVLVQEFAADNGVVHFTNNAINDVTMEDCTETTFRWVARNSTQANASVPWVVDNLGSNVWIHYADYNWGQEATEEFKALFEEHGGVNVVGETSSQLGTQDFSSYLSQMSASDADWVLQNMVGGDAIVFLNQAGEYGLKEQMDIYAGANSLRIVRAATGAASIGTYSVAEYYEHLDTPGNNEFKEVYGQMFDGLPSRFVSDSWSMLTGWAKAANQSSPATGDIVSTIGGLEFETPVGPAAFRSCDHQASRPVMVSQITEPGRNEWPDLDILNTVSREDALIPCSDVPCDL